MPRLKIGSGSSTPIPPRTAPQVASTVTSVMPVTVHSEKVIEKHTTVLKESRDKWVRRHSKLTAKAMRATIDDLSETLNQQNEVLRASHRGIHNLVQEMDKLREELAILKIQKPEIVEQKHTVTNTHEVRTKTPTAMWIALGISVTLSILSLVLKH